MKSVQANLADIELEESVVPSTAGAGMIGGWGGLIIGAGLIIVVGAIVIVP
jgi:hypothetical protein